MLVCRNLLFNVRPLEARLAALSTSVHHLCSYLGESSASVQLGSTPHPHFSLRVEAEAGEEGHGVSETQSH